MVAAGMNAQPGKPRPLTAHEQLEYERPARRIATGSLTTPSVDTVLDPPSRPRPNSWQLGCRDARARPQGDPDCRLRFPVLWTIPGDLPDDDAVLTRLAAGVAFTGWGGRA